MQLEFAKLLISAIDYKIGAIYLAVDIKQQVLLLNVPVLLDKLPRKKLKGR